MADAEAGGARRTYINPDESGEIIKQRFQSFLETYARHTTRHRRRRPCRPFRFHPQRIITAVLVAACVAMNPSV